MSLVKINFESKYLSNNTEVGILLPNPPKGVDPKDFYPNGEKYKVLWLLHGSFGDYSDWIRKTMIEIYARERNLIVVMPSALNSNYSNWDDTMTGYRMFDFLTEELMPMIYGWFPASDKRDDNFIAGLSMGGEGALKYAVNHPDKFGGAAILSMYCSDIRALAGGKTELTAEEEQAIIKELPTRQQNTIRNAGGLLRYINSYENTWELLNKLNQAGKLPKLYVTCGTDDFLYDKYTVFRKYAEEMGIPALFEDVPGYKHEWRFWDRAIERALDYFGVEAVGIQGKSSQAFVN